MGALDRAAYLRVAQQYGPILAELRRDLARNAAEQDAKIATRRRTGPAQPRRERPEPEADFSSRTWLR